jgi:HK97 family phage major capsid protein
MTGTESPVLAGMRAQKKAKHLEAKTILDNPSASDAQLKKAIVLTDEIEKLDAEIQERAQTEWDATQAKHAFGEMDNRDKEPIRRMPFSGAPAQKGYQFDGRIETGKSEIDKKMMTGGFKSLGHFGWAQVKRGRHNDGEPSALQAFKAWNDLQTKAPSGMFEQSDPDGGDLIPPQFSNQIYERMVAKNLILQYLSPITVSGNTMTIPALKEDSRADGLRGGGILGYWDGEANQYTFSKSRYRNVNLRLHKLTVYTAATDELINDSPIALEQFLLRKAPEEINFKINDAVINGGGDGIPLGMLNAGSLITVTAVSGQGVNTFIYQNVTSMWSRAVAGQRGSAIWLYSQDVEPQLFQMYLPTGTAAGVAVLTPNEAQPGGFKLMSRPALVMEQCQPLGTAGDVILFCPDGYVAITKGGIESFMSMHLRFDYDETVFKWRFRFDAQPFDNVALTPYKSSNTVSSVVVLNSTRT